MPTLHATMRPPGAMLAIVAGFMLLALAAVMLALAVGSVPVSFGALVRGLVEASDTEKIARDIICAMVEA